MGADCKVHWLLIHAVMCTWVWQVQGYPLYHLVKAQTEKQAGAKEDALASLQTAMSFITSKKPGTQAVRLGKSIGCQFYMLQSVCTTYMYDPLLICWCGCMYLSPCSIHVLGDCQYTCIHVLLVLNCWLLVFYAQFNLCACLLRWGLRSSFCCLAKSALCKCFKIIISKSNSLFLSLIVCSSSPVICFAPCTESQWEGHRLPGTSQHAHTPRTTGTNCLANIYTDTTDNKA